jgi:hypothetical protein
VLDDDPAAEQPPASGESPTRFVSDDYALLPGDTEAAWPLLSSELQSRVGSYEDYDAFWSTIDSVTADETASSGSDAGRPAYDEAVSDDAPRAGTAYSVSLEPAASVTAWSLAWARGPITATAALIGSSEAPVVGDLVVHRTADGSEAIRAGAGDQEESASLLDHVQRQLEELGGTEFEATWALDAESARA